jgi:formylglycine-generating enzyme required for sulfatase activity
VSADGYRLYDRWSDALLQIDVPVGISPSTMELFDLDLWGNALHTSDLQISQGGTAVWLNSGPFTGTATVDVSGILSPSLNLLAMSQTGLQGGQVLVTFPPIVYDVPSADFTADVTQGAAPLSVQFTDTSVGQVAFWAWDLDSNGTPDSTINNPTWTYNTPGDYSVRLSVVGPGGNDDEIKSAYIIVQPPSTVPGDWNGDGQVNLVDYVGIEGCLGGPNLSPSPTPPVTLSNCLQAFDFDLDADVDLRDFGYFETLFTTESPPSCMNDAECDDGVGCTLDSCDDVLHVCVNVASNGLCENGLFCDGNETCDLVLDCQAGTDPCLYGTACDEGTDTCNVIDDCNTNGIPDQCDIACGTAGSPCSVYVCGTSSDCNGNAIPDECDLAAGTSEDCNTNAVPDVCDVAAGTSEDVDTDGVPDECNQVLALQLGSGVTMEFIRIPAGFFTMGSTNGSPVELPLHDVEISQGFFIARTEVTQAQYQEVMGTNPSANTGCNNCPVENASWNDATAFCAALSSLTGYSVRLPTEAEWEYAARCNTTTEYSFGDDPAGLASYAWYQLNSGLHSGEVATKAPSQWGLFDMYGNVEEWCNDWFGASYYSDPAATGPDPAGPATGTDRVTRGGGWNAVAANCRSATRGGRAPTTTSDRVGFRVIIVVPDVD